MTHLNNIKLGYSVFSGKFFYTATGKIQMLR